MRTRPIGALQVSVVGLGCNNFGWRIDENETEGVVDAAIDAGITLFDTADIYGGTKSEEFLGRVLSKSGRRSKIVLATKFGMEVDDARKGAAPAYVRQACGDFGPTVSIFISSIDPIRRPPSPTPWQCWTRSCVKGKCAK